MDKSKKLNMLLIFGSPHEDGFTAALTKSFVNKINKGDMFDIVVVKAYEQTIHPCIGCSLCNRENTCVYDDFDSICDLISNADAIVIASPIYFLSFPSPLKAIVDRCQRYYAAHFVRKERPTVKKPKIGSLLLTCGSDDDFGAQVTEKQAKQLYSVINTKYIGKAIFSSTDKSDKNDVPVDQIDKLVQKLIENMKTL